MSSITPPQNSELTIEQEIAPGQESIAENDVNPLYGTAETGEGDGAQKDLNGPVGQGVSQTHGFGAGFGFDPSAAGGFPGMGFGGDMNQMQRMMAMQNGMGAGNFGNFPMIGKLTLSLTRNMPANDVKGYLE